MNNENIVYVKIKNGIFKCYKSEQMHKPIYYPVESKTNGYIDYNDVEKILTIEDLYQENQELKRQLEERPKEYVFIGNAQNKTRDFINQITKDNKEFKNQQKKFIEYLEDLIKQNGTVVEVSKYGLPKNCSKLLIDFYKEILQKYKEIIGVSDENNMEKSK